MIEWPMNNLHKCQVCTDKPRKHRMGSLLRLEFLIPSQSYAKVFMNSFKCFVDQDLYVLFY